MRHIILKTNQEIEVRIRPDPPGNRLFRRFEQSPLTSVELLHVKWSGEAIFFLHNMGDVPIDEELRGPLTPGIMSYLPQLGEFILSYGTSEPRDQKGSIPVAKVGLVEDVAELRSLGNKVWRQGAQTVRVSVEQD